MIWVIGFLTFLLVVDCLFLILLVLVQLPKKEAGMGQAFGGAATDALFGAGSGNALTKMTKYAAVFFFIITLTLSVLNSAQASRKSALEQELQKTSKSSDLPGPAATTPAVPAIPAPPTATNTTLLALTNKATGAVSALTNKATNPVTPPPAAEKGK